MTTYLTTSSRSSCAYSYWTEESRWCRDFDPTIPCDEAEAARWATAMTLGRRNRCGYDHAHCLSPLPALDARGS